MNTKIKFLHIRRPAISLRTDGMTIERAGPFGGITVAYRDVGNGAYEVAFARCRNNERYNKRTGRGEATGKLLSSAIYTPGRKQVIECAADESPLEQIAALVYASSAMRKNLRPAILRSAS